MVLQSGETLSGRSASSHRRGSTASDRPETLEEFVSSELGRTPSNHRRQAALDLVNRFYRQIRYGCQNSACITPTCCSSQRRRTKGPFRRFTVLSARALAATLASERNALDKLCPHPPVQDERPHDRAFSTDELPSSIFLTKLLAYHGLTFHYITPTSEAATRSEAALVVSRTNLNLALGNADTHHGTSSDVGARNDSDKQECRELVSERSWKESAVPGERKGLPKGKDPKSLLQSTFDSQTFKMAEQIESKECSYRLLGQSGIAHKSFPKIPLKPVSAPRFQEVIANEDFTHRIFSALWKRLDLLFITAPTVGLSPEVVAQQAQEAAEMIKFTFAAMDGTLGDLRYVDREAWVLLVTLRRAGQYAPSQREEQKLIRHVLNIMDHFEDEIGLRLTVKLVQAYAARLCCSEASRARSGQIRKSSSTPDGFSQFVHTVMEDILDHTLDLENRSEHKNSPKFINLRNRVPYGSIILERLRGVILHEWDGKPIIDKYGAVGGAIDFISQLYEQRHTLNLPISGFSMPFLSDRLDSLDMPVEWFSWQPARNTTHLLSFPFLFTPTALVTYFRAINFVTMAKKYENSVATFHLAQRMFPIARDEQVHNRLKISTAGCLVLEIRRDSILKDAMDQLWRRQKRELLRPLKVRMGMDEGEEGVDHGGVQQEFFRIAFGEALNPDYGLFTTDTRTRMAWFKPGTLEPSYKFELLGLLASLAVYNGLTLPITFPLALYRQLLGNAVTDIQHIEDGWPESAKGLAALLSWSESNVEDVFMMSYVFSIETGDGVVDVDMERPSKWSPQNRLKAEKPTPRLYQRTVQEPSGSVPGSLPGSPHHSHNSSESWVSLHKSDVPLSDTNSAHILPANGHSQSQTTDSNVEGPGLVTNENRERYVADYISWLTDKSIRPQYEAFARGFYHCLDKKALSLFTAEALQAVVEGSQNINLNELEAVTRYENGYSAQHRVIRDFWALVRSYSQEKVRKLLEFVTASDRIPVRGVSSILFVIQRNGTNDERLPTSLTCFGRLLLPEYSTKKKLDERLSASIENSQGFGVA